MTSSNKSIKWFNGPTRSGYFSQSTVSSRSASLAPSEILPSRDSNLISLLFPASCFLIRGNNVWFRTLIWANTYVYVICGTHLSQRNPTLSTTLLYIYPKSVLPYIQLPHKRFVLYMFFPSIAVLSWAVPWASWHSPRTWRASRGSPRWRTDPIIRVVAVSVWAFCLSLSKSEPFASWARKNWNCLISRFSGLA